MRKLERLLPVAFLVAACIIVAPVFHDPSRFANSYDWHYFQTWIEIARRTIGHFHQLPLWNPYTCGGQVQLANPQAMAWSPTTILPILFGTALGTKLFLVVYVFFALDGMYRLARHFQLSVEASLIASVMFGTNGWLALHLAVGHPNFAGAALFPYLVLFYRRSLEDLRYATILGAFAAWVVGLGGTSTPAIAAVLLATVAVCDVAARRDARPLLAIACGGGWALLLGGARILPALEFAIDHPRRMHEVDSMSLAWLLRAGFESRGLGQAPGLRYGFHEYGWHLPLVTIPLIVVSFAARATRRFWWIALVGAAISLGNAIPYGPWWMLKHLPVYRDLRVPSRYTILLAFAACLLVAGAGEFIFSKWRPAARLRYAITALLVLACAFEGIRYNWLLYDGVFKQSAVVASAATPIFQEEGHWSRMMDIVLTNHGVIKCDEEAPLQRALTLDVGDVPQMRLEDPTRGDVRNIVFTPNRFEADVTLTAPTRLLINQNWNEHFVTNVGRIDKFGEKVAMDHDGGRLSVGDLPTGTSHVVVRYRPMSFIVGMIASLIGLLLALYVYFVGRPRSTQPRQPPAIDNTLR